MELVLIVGMIGFGLFGSAVSTFVRTAANESLEPNVVYIIVRGTSAAIVIFLAVKGGISIFIKGDSQLNPYSLFFTCLIGAVYSERVWDWAKSELEAKFSKANEVEETAQQSSTNTSTTP